MSHTALTSAVARLLTDRELLQHFRAAPYRAAQRVGVSSHDLHTFVRMDADELYRQANALVDKRWHETSKLIPLTVAQLGREGRQLFHYYAHSYWPVGHRRHALDALKFMGFLTTNQILKVNCREFMAVRSLSRRLPSAAQ